MLFMGEGNAQGLAEQPIEEGCRSRGKGRERHKSPTLSTAKNTLYPTLLPFRTSNFYSVQKLWWFVMSVIGLATKKTKTPNVKMSDLCAVV